MDIDTLHSLGFVVTAGKIDRSHINYGTLTKDGPELTDAGEKLVRVLLAAIPVVAEPEKAQRGRPRKILPEYAAGEQREQGELQFDGV